MLRGIFSTATTNDDLADVPRLRRIPDTEMREE
jgi:hypothetical protein